MSTRRFAQSQVTAGELVGHTDPMRWDDLFADLEAQLDLLASRERAADVSELARAEIAKIGLVLRLLPSVGAPVSLRCLGDLRTSGTLQRVGPDWLLLDEGAGREALVPLAAVLTAGGLGRLSAPANSLGRVESRLGLASALRGLARDRAPVRVHLVDATVLGGTIDRVGADFFELATHPGGDLRRRSEVQQVLIVSYRAVSAIRRDT
ncbi:MAG: uncharacterized protein JWM76_2098 [Pseudonocardiales bacterium]|nr:uncharacterized protein [Pseudonocardiales bacterium]